MAQHFVTAVCVLSLLCCVYGYTSSFYTDNDLGQSIPMGRFKRRHREEVQQELLELMGLYSQPKVKSKDKMVQSASHFMRDLYDSIRQLDGREAGTSGDTHIHIGSEVNASALGLDPAMLEGTDVIVSFVNNGHKMPHLRHEKHSTFYFDFSKVSVGEQIRGAELRIFKEKSESLGSSPLTINLYQIQQGQDWEDKLLSLESSMTVTADREGWLILDATEVAAHWTLFPHSNMGLYLKVVDMQGNQHSPQSVGLVNHGGPADKQPFLVGYMDMSPELLSRRARSIRSRRWTQTGDDVTYSDNPYAEYSKTPYAHNRAHNTCQRHNLFINFRDIGFGSEFLLAPEGYKAFYCDGDCSFPLGIHMNATNHAIVQTLVHLMEPRHVPKPCCAPTQFGTISLLYYDDNSSVVLKRFRDMTVLACGCH